VPQSIAHTGNKMLVAGVVILLASIAGFIYTASYTVLLAPALFYYILLKITDWKAAFWLMLFCIPFSIEVNLSDTLSVSLPDEPMMWLFLLLTMLLIAENPTRITASFLFHPIAIVVALQFAWLIVAVVFSHVPFLSLKFLIAKVWMLGCFFILPPLVFKESKDFKKGFLLLLVPVSATIVYVMVRHAAVHYRFDGINGAIGALYSNHVEYSTIISMVLPLLCMALPVINSRKRWLKILVVALILFFLIAIFFTYARAAILAVIFAVLIALSIRLKLVNMVMPCFYGFVALLMVYMINDNKYIDFRPDYEQTYMHKGFTDHIIATFKGQDMSSMERLYRWIAAIRMSNDEPLTGYGPHGFVPHYKPYTVLSFRTYVSNNPEKSTTHNYFLYMLTEQGWPAMILYAILITVIFASAQSTYHRFKEPFYKNCTLALAMMVAACFVNNFFSDLIETHKVGALFYLSLSLLVVLDIKSRQVAATHPRP